MFSTFHIIMLVVSLVISIPLAIYLAKTKVTIKRVLFICMILAAFSEFIRATYFTIVLDSGNEVVNPLWLPLQLCSIQIIFIFVMYFTKKEETRNKLIAFFIPTAFWGALLAIFIPTTYTFLNDLHIMYPDGGYPEGYGTWHRLSINFFLYHAMLVFMALFFFIRKYKEFKFKESFIACFSILIMLFVFSILMNSIMAIGEVDTNFFFTSGPPMDGLPLLTLENGWVAYLMTLVVLGTTLIALTYLPVFLRDKKTQ